MWYRISAMTTLYYMPYFIYFQCVFFYNLNFDLKYNIKIRTYRSVTLVIGSKFYGQGIQTSMLLNIWFMWQAIQ